MRFKTTALILLLLAALTGCGPDDRDSAGEYSSRTSTTSTTVFNQPKSLSTDSPLRFEHRYVDVRLAVNLHPGAKPTGYLHLYLKRDIDLSKTMWRRPEGLEHLWSDSALIERLPTVRMEAFIPVAQADGATVRLWRPPVDCQLLIEHTYSPFAYFGADSRVEDANRSVFAKADPATVPEDLLTPLRDRAVMINPFEGKIPLVADGQTEPTTVYFNINIRREWVPVKLQVSMDDIVWRLNPHVWDYNESWHDHLGVSNELTIPWQSQERFTDAPPEFPMLRWEWQRHYGVSHVGNDLFDAEWKLYSSDILLSRVAMYEEFPVLGALESEYFIHDLDSVTPERELRSVEQYMSDTLLIRAADGPLWYRYAPLGCRQFFAGVQLKDGTAVLFHGDDSDCDAEVLTPVPVPIEWRFLEFEVDDTGVDRGTESNSISMWYSVTLDCRTSRRIRDSYNRPYKPREVPNEFLDVPDAAYRSHGEHLLHLRLEAFKDNENGRYRCAVPIGSQLQEDYVVTNLIAKLPDGRLANFWVNNEVERMPTPEVPGRIRLTKVRWDTRWW